MQRRALLFGLNYLNEPAAALSGCINDVQNVEQALLKLGYTLEDILKLTDHTVIKPTRRNMLRTLKQLALWSHQHPGSQVFVGYSGHGSSVVDHNDDEKDGRDEVLVPLDHATAGVITDDELAQVLRGFHASTDVVLLFDACHSGTMADLPFRYIAGDKFVREQDTSFPARILLLSGCQDNQTSQETWSFADDRKITGMMTSSLLATLNAHAYDLTCYQLLKYMLAELQKLGVTQRPQLSSSRRLSATCAFVTSHENQPWLQAER